MSITHLLFLYYSLTAMKHSTMQHILQSESTDMNFWKIVPTQINNWYSIKWYVDFELVYDNGDYDNILFYFKFRFIDWRTELEYLYPFEPKLRRVVSYSEDSTWYTTNFDEMNINYKDAVNLLKNKSADLLRHNVLNYVDVWLATQKLRYEDWLITTY